VITAEREDAHSQNIVSKIFFGDSVTFTRMRAGLSLQAELGKNAGPPVGFNDTFSMP